MDTLPAETKKEILDAIASNQKLEAVRLYKLAKGCDLKTAKIVIESFMLGQIESDRGRLTGDFPGVDEQEAGLILDDIFGGRKLDAVKRYRSTSGCNLKESKEFIEALIERLKKESPDQFRPNVGSGCASSILIVAVVFLIASTTFGMLSLAFLN